MKPVIPDEEKEQLIDLAYQAVRSGLANGDYQNIDIKIKSMMRDRMHILDNEAQIYMLKDLIVYVRKRIHVPGGRLGAIGLINIGRVKGVPTFLLDCGHAIWGTLFSDKADAGKLQKLIMT